MFDFVLIVELLKLGVSAKGLSDLYKQYKNVKQPPSKNIIAERNSAINTIVSNNLYTILLNHLYPKEDLLASGLYKFKIYFDGHLIPTTIVGNRNTLQTEIDLNNFSENHQLTKQVNVAHNLDSDLIARILVDIEYRNLKVWNQPIYRLTDIAIHNSALNATFVIDSFMAYRLGLGALWDELLQSLIFNKYNIDTIIKNKERHFKIRNKLLPNAESVAQYSNRMCAGGIHATVAIQRPKPWNDFVIPLQKRISTISEGQNMLSVIPQAFHQPMIDPQAELNFSQTFYREFFEELFGGEEVVTASHHLRHDWFMDSSPPLKWLKQNQDSYRLLLTGFGINLVAGNYEMALLCVIHDNRFWNKFSHMLMTNWESDKFESLMVSTKNEELMNKIILRKEWTGAGLFSFCRGLHSLNKIEPIMMCIPEIMIKIE